MKRVILYLMAVFLVSGIGAYAADGDFDTNFDGDGKVNPVTGGGDSVNDIVVQPDGKTIVVGGNAAFSVQVARFNVDGSFDNTFNGTGIVHTNFGSSDVANGVALQSDGKIVVAGHYNPGNNDIIMARYNTDGSLDNTFNGNGQYSEDVLGAGNHDYFNDVAIQSDGKIVAAGYWTGGDTDFMLYRFTSTGALDTTFDGDGRVFTDIGNDDNCFAMAIQADGKILAAGYASMATNDFAIVRYNSDGSLDAAFGVGGIVTVDNAGGDDAVQSIAIQTDGKIVAAGSTDSQLAVLRFNSNGSLDTTFDSDGKIFMHFDGASTSSYAYDVVLQDDNKIVVAGLTNVGGVNSYAVARFEPDGALDTTFDADGKKYFDFGGASYCFGVALGTNNSIFLGGSYNNDIAVAKLQSSSMKPTISNFSPGSGGLGTNVSIDGTNFIAGAVAKFGGTAASSTVINSVISITAVVGGGSSGPVTVTTKYGTATSGGSFTHASAGIPTLTEWGIILFTVLLAGTSVVMIRRRRAIY